MAGGAIAGSPLSRVRKRDADSAFDAAWPLGGLRKRAFDLAIAGFSLIMLAPLLLATALLVRFVFGRGVIDAQECIGFSGRVFARYTFRTSIATRPVPWAEAVGAGLRSSGLDQLAQLFNVLRGDMSVVGPQPSPAGHASRDHLQSPETLKARPGLVGMWHSGDRNRIALDRYYVRHWSIGLDGALLIRAFLAGFRFDVRHPAGPPCAAPGASQQKII